MSEWVDFRSLKEQVRLCHVIGRYGVTLQAVASGVLRGRCPLPTHGSQDSALSFSINSAKNVWACHSQSCIVARGGAIGGNVLDFVAAMEGCSIRAAALLLRHQFGMAGENTSALRPIRQPALAPANRALGFQLFGLDPLHAYISERGISPATARLFGIGYYAGRGFLSGRVAIPIHNEAGALVAYAGRSVDEQLPKYKLPPAFRKSSELFNLHRAAHRRGAVVVVEGFFDCMQVHQAGFANVVALMGCTLSMQQRELLERCFASVILLLDGDEAGRNATVKIAASLSAHMTVHCGHVPIGRQPDQLSAEELRSAVEDATSNA